MLEFRRAICHDRRGRDGKPRKGLGWGRSLVWVFMVLGLALQLPMARAATDSGSSGQPQTADQWLAKLAPALTHVSYEGVFVYARGGEVNSMRIFHRFRDGKVRERLIQLDGANGEVVRNGSRITYIYPDNRRIHLDKVLPSGPFAEAFSHPLAPVTRWYLPRRLKDDRVAGYATAVLELKARDRNRYSYRLWLEKKTGLLVKSEVLSLKGKVLERFQFTDLNITDAIPDDDLVAHPAGRDVTKTDIPSRVDREPDHDHDQDHAPVQWRLGWRPHGFVASVAPSEGSGGSVAYSDGMASFSVFVERPNGANMPSGASRIGATTAYIRKVPRHGKTYLVTVVGEIPPKTAMQVANGISLGH